MKPHREINLLSALMGGVIPNSIIFRKKPENFWEYAEESAREVNTWPQWKRNAADKVYP